MFVVVNNVSIADPSEGRYEMDIRKHAEQHLVNQPGFRRLELLYPEIEGDYLLLAYWDSEAAFERWTGTDDFEAAHDELFGTMFLEQDYTRPEVVDQTEAIPFPEIRPLGALRYRHLDGRRVRRIRVLVVWNDRDSRVQILVFEAVHPEVESSSVLNRHTRLSSSAIVVSGRTTISYHCSQIRPFYFHRRR